MYVKIKKLNEKFENQYLKQWLHKNLNCSNQLFDKDIKMPNWRHHKRMNMKIFCKTAKDNFANLFDTSEKKLRLLR